MEGPSLIFVKVCLCDSVSVLPEKAVEIFKLLGAGYSEILLGFQVLNLQCSLALLTLVR